MSFDGAFALLFLQLNGLACFSGHQLVKEKRDFYWD